MSGYDRANALFERDPKFRAAVAHINQALLPSVSEERRDNEATGPIQGLG